MEATTEKSTAPSETTTVEGETRKTHSRRYGEQWLPTAPSLTPDASDETQGESDNSPDADWAES